jgi:hydrogenase maturation protease
MIRVLFFGNAMHGDDGLGPALCQALAAMPLPAQISLHDLGQRVFDALGLLEASDSVVLVDALAPLGHPGRAHELTPADFCAQRSALSLHHLSVPDMLALLSIRGVPAPEMHIFAVEAAELGLWSCRLSDSLEAAMPALSAQLHARLLQLAKQHLPVLKA